MTGDDKKIGQQIIKATRMALKDINSDNIEIFPKDTGSNPTLTLKSAKELQQLVEFMKQCKKEFKLADIDDIAFNKRTNNIDKYIIDDQEELQIGLKCPANVKAAGYYNYILNNNKKYKNKYKLIANGEKLKIYNCIGQISEVYAFMPNEHPYEIAPKVDYDTQFEKAMIDPLNRVLTAIGLQTLDTNLIYASALF